MHACATCDDLRRQVRELEETLDRAIYATDDARARLVWQLRVSPQQADLINLLYRAGQQYVPTVDLEAALPRAEVYGLARQTQDTEFRSVGFVSAVVLNTRARLGTDFIESRVRSGYRLSNQARERVHQILNTESHQ